MFLIITILIQIALAVPLTITTTNKASIATATTTATIKTIPTTTPVVEKITEDGICDLQLGIICPPRYDCVLPYGNTPPGIFWCITEGLGLDKSCISDCIPGSGCLNEEISGTKKYGYCRGDLICTSSSDSGKICSIPLQ